MDVGVGCGMILMRTQNEERANNAKINDIAMTFFFVKY